MFGLVSQSKYQDALDRAVRAEARVEQFERQAKAVTASELKAHEDAAESEKPKKATRKPSRKVAVKHEETPAQDITVTTDEVAATESLNAALPTAFDRNKVGKLSMSKADIQSRTDYVKNQVSAGGVTVSDVALATGLTDSTVRAYLKK